MKPATTIVSIVTLVVACAATGVATAAVPAQVSYQGVLTDNNGTAVPDGNYTVTFRLYTLDQGGSPVWTETHLLPVVGGVFGVVLGSVTPLDLPFDTAYYMGVSVDGGAEMAPRRKLTAAAYSLTARAVDAGAAVTSLNGLTDDVSIIGGDNVTVTQAGNTLTITSGGGGTTPSGGNTLDAAYDEGGPGLGREITADSGPVHVKGADGLRVDGKVGIGIADPAVSLDVFSSDFYAIYGETNTGDDVAAGVCGALNNTAAGGGSSGVLGICLDPTATTNGVWGDHAGVGLGVFGTAPDGFGVAGFAYGTQNENVGVYGESAAVGLGWAGYFYGDIAVLGQVYAGGGAAMLIDNPLDPERQYLQHPAVHSPDMMNIYDGNVVLDESGEAVVELPDYFEALNGDYRYQLTAVGAPAPNLHVAEEISGNRFRIAGGVPGMKVSWTVTGVRRDPQAERMDRSVVRDKKPAAAGRYFNPAAYGKGRDMSTLHAAHPGLFDQMTRGIRALSKRTRRE